MKTKYWILLLSIILTGCIVLSVPLLTTGKDAAYAEIISDGTPIQIVDLNIPQEIRIVTPNGGSNTVTVKNGRIGVTSANCPDHYCMERGMCSNGVQIVCLPNKLIIRFLGEQTVDSVAG